MFNKKFQRVSLFFLLLVIGVFYLQSHFERPLTQSTLSEASLGVEKGEKASPFSAKDLKGNTISLEDFSGQKIILMFFTSWCEVCGEQWMQFEQAEKKGLLAETKLLAVNVTKAERHVTDVKNYAAHLPIQDLTLILDEEGLVQDLYKVIGIPTVIFIDDSGLIINRNHGFLNLEQLEEILRK